MSPRRQTRKWSKVACQLTGLTRPNWPSLCSSRACSACRRHLASQCLPSATTSSGFFNSSMWSTRRSREDSAADTHPASISTRFKSPWAVLVRRPGTDDGSVSVLSGEEMIESASAMNSETRSVPRQRHAHRVGLIAATPTRRHRSRAFLQETEGPQGGCPERRARTCKAILAEAWCWNLRSSSSRSPFYHCTAFSLSEWRATLGSTRAWRIKSSTNSSYNFPDGIAMKVICKQGHGMAQAFGIDALAQGDGGRYLVDRVAMASTRRGSR